MMRGCFKAALAFGMVAILAGPAMAQGRGGMGMMGGGGPITLLSNPSVQKELKLDLDQTSKATELATETREQMMGLRDQLSDLQGQERMAKQQELAKPINEKAMNAASEFLKPEQIKRLNQIELQQRGANALSDPAIAKKLGVTEEQTTKFKSIMADQMSEMREIMQSAGDDRQAANTKMQSLRKETNTKVMAMMTEAQTKMWKEMTGEPFEVVYQPRGNR